MTDTAKDDSVTTSGDEAAVEAEAERQFAEAVEAREGTPAEKPAGTDVDTTASAQDDATAEATTTGEGTATAEGQSGGSEGAAATAAASGEGDIWADADPKLKAAFEEAAKRADRAEQQFKSREGREAALQRQIVQLRTGEGQEQPRKPLKELLESDQLKEIGTEYPDFQAVLDTLRTVAERVDGVEEQVGQVKTVAASAGSAAEERALNEAVPNWLELAKDERFLGWVDDQPREIREAVSANWDAITDAKQAAKAFTSFAEHIKPAEQTGGEGGAPGKRERQAQGAKGAKVSAPASAQGESDDPEVQFAQAAAKKDRERGIIK